MPDAIVALQPYLHLQNLTKRIFVTKSCSDAVSFVILTGNTKSDWELFLKKIQGEFGFAAGSSIKVSLAEVNVTITSGDHLQANDKVVVEEI